MDDILLLAALLLAGAFCFDTIVSHPIGFLFLLGVFTFIFM